MRRDRKRMDDVPSMASSEILLYSGLCMEHPRVCARCLDVHRLTSEETSCLSQFLGVFNSITIVLDVSIFFILDGSSTSDYWRVNACLTMLPAKVKDVNSWPTYSELCSQLFRLRAFLLM